MSVISLAAGRPFLPHLVTDWFARTPSARWQLVEGSMVFVDISGFTAMSERLARQGRVGAEEVTTVISATFDHLLGVALGHGGDPLKFGGDAQLVFFRGSNHETRAAAAALGMRAELRRVGRFHTSAGQVTLRMSAGAHTGEFHFFLVGGSHRELVVTGPGASATVTMEAAAGPGQILASPQLAARLPTRHLGQQHASGTLLKGAPRASSPDDLPATRGEAEQDVTSLIPVALRPLVQDRVGAEHRPATVAFIHFHGVDALIGTAGEDVAATALDDLIRMIQASADRHEVAFLATDIATDGGKVILCAGAPNATGRDDEHLLLALREIVTAPTPLPIKIGVNRGPVFSGEVGPGYRRTYTVMGDAVNLAARLMARAGDGEVLATLPVIDGSRTRFAATPLAPFMVKGKRRPVQAFNVGGPIGGDGLPAHRALPLIGRSQELAAMLEAWQEARRGAGRLIDITAEPGMGKSRLVEEFLRQAEPPRVLHSELRRDHSATPYHPFQELLRQALDLEGLDDATTIERLGELVAARVPHLGSWLSLIGVPLDLDIPASPGAVQIREEFRRTRLEEAIDELLATVLTEPVVVMIEDVQWIDDASRDLLLRLAGRVASRPWLICLTGHPGAADSLTELDRLQLRLEPLSEAAAGALIAAAAGETALLPQQIHALAARAHGNPLFLIELVRALERGDDLQALPHGVEGLIQARIDRLPLRDRTGLRHLSVLGTTFELRHAADVLSEVDMECDDIETRLGDFVTVGPAGFARFEHSLIRDVAYSGLPYRTRRQLHAKVALAMRAEGEDSEERAALLSAHFFHAGEWDEAWTYSRVAGDGAKRRYANVEAATFYERALAAARRLGSKEPADVATVTEALGDVHDRSGSYADAGRNYRAARRLAAAPLVEARLRLKEAWIEEKRGRYSQALRWLTLGDRAINDLTGREAEAVRAQLAVWRAAMRLLQGRFDDSIAWADRAIAAADRGDDRDALAHALYLRDAAAVYLGRDIDETGSRRALAIYEQLGDLSGQAIVANNLAGFAYFAGRWSEAVALYERSRTARLQAGDPVEAVRAGAGIGEIRCDQGDLAGAREALEEALAVWRAARYPFGVAFVTSQLGRVASRDGQFDTAEGLYTDARVIYTELKARSDVLETDTRLAENLVFAGRTAEAAARVERARAQAMDLGGDPVQLPRIQLLAGYVAAQDGDLDRARQEFAASRDNARARRATYDLAVALEAVARLARLEGRPDWRETLAECWSAFDELGVVSVPRIPLGASG